jgi:hypothetical protein
MKSITSKVNREDMENARIDRNREINPAEVEPGMGDFDWDNDATPTGGSPAGWGSSANNTMSGPFGSTDTQGGLGGFGGFGGAFGQQPPVQKEDDVEEKFWLGLKKLGSGFIKFTGELVSSFKTFDVMVRMRTGKSIFITGVITAIAGLLLILFGFGNQLGMSLLVGGLVSTGVGVPLFMFSYDDVMKNGVPELQGTTDMPEGDMETNFDDFGDFADDEDEDVFDIFGDDDDSDIDTSDFTEDLDFSAFEENETSEEEISQNMGSTLNGLNISNGMVTRQYLYENIIACLMNVNQNFDNVRSIQDGSDEFDAWDAIIQNSAGVFKPKGSEVDLPYLITAKEKLFYIILEIRRVNWIKNIDSFVSEIVNICRFDEDTGKTDTSIYGVGNTVGDKIYVKIMKGETAMVTVKDTYKNVADDIKNSNHFLPIVMGLDAEGHVVWQDFKDINSILVTGMPRSGKTWLVQSILCQMMFYLKPSELNFYILDPKDQISDFKAMEMPHIRKFVSNDADILKELSNIVKIEGPRRKKIIGDAGFVNIWDFKKRNPDVDLPLLYVVIDEVITLAERMTKETKDEFQSLLLELVSQLPALGIRIFMIPHVVKDNILKKSITDLIPCRISVRGDAEHIERTVGAKNFKHKLFNQGDMAVRFNNDEPMFIHSAVLTNSNESNNDLFSFLLKFWLKLEPESINGSLHSKKQLKDKNKSNRNTRESFITLETPVYENTSSKRDTKVLSKEEIAELVESMHTDFQP